MVNRLITIKKPTSDTYKGWGFVLIGGLVLAVGALLDRGSDEVGCRFEVTADAVNIRVEANQGADAVGDPLGRGDEVEGTATVVDGFRQLEDGRWAFDQYLTPVPGAECG